MELIEKYVYAVVSKLPEQQREEIAKEIRGLIYDMAEQYRDLSSETESITKALHELGDPSQLAEQYRGKPRYLIGPQYFNRYLFVLRIVFFAVFIGISISSLVSGIFIEELSFSKLLAQYIGTLTAALFQGFAWVTIIFAVIEYKGVDLNEKQTSKKWNVNMLEPVPNKKTIISRVESIVGIIFTILFMVLIYFYPQLVAIYISENNEFITFPLFNVEGLKTFNLFIIIIFGIGLMREMLKFFYGKWTISLAISYTVLTVISTIFILYVFLNPVIWNVNIGTQLADYFDITNAYNIDWETARDISSKIIIFASIIDIGTVIYKSIRYSKVSNL